MKFCLKNIFTDSVLSEQLKSDVYRLWLALQHPRRKCALYLRAVPITVLRGDHLFFGEIWDLRWDMCWNLQIWAYSAAYYTPWATRMSLSPLFSESEHDLSPHKIRFCFVHRRSSCPYGLQRGCNIHRYSHTRKCGMVVWRTWSRTRITCSSWTGLANCWADDAAVSLANSCKSCSPARVRGGHYMHNRYGMWYHFGVLT